MILNLTAGSFSFFSLSRRAAIAAEPDPTDDPTEDLPVYLHLEHARVRSGNTIIADDVRWRARLTSVDGWSLGAHT